VCRRVGVLKKRVTFFRLLLTLINEANINLLLNCTTNCRLSLLLKLISRIDLKMYNSSKVTLYKVLYLISRMAVAPQSAVESLGFVPGQGHVPGPSYTRFTIVDIWDGAQRVPTVMHLPLSTSLITSLLLQCDPDEVIR